MKFEQAFYTRGIDLINNEGSIGLGIAASSNRDPQFIAKCMEVGSKFNTERTEDVEKTAEFVMYSEAFEKFIGIGVSPAPNREGGDVNKLVHMYIPETASDQSEEYYLPYKFWQNVEKKSDLGTVEIESCLKKSDFMQILKKYNFDRDKLAKFLWRMISVIYGKENLLLIVLDENRYEKGEFSAIARELTWLASCLIPECGDTLLRRKRLSYAVYSRENISVANLAYVTDETLHTNRFFLNGQNTEEVPELCYVLAENALHSYQAYLEFVAELQKNRIEENIDTTNLLIMFLQWKLNQGNISIQKQDIPISVNALVHYAGCKNEYRSLLYKCVIALNFISKKDLKKIWEKICWAIKKPQEQENQECFLSVKKIIRLFYGIDKKKYQSCLGELPGDIRKKVIEELYTEEDSCIQKELMHISSIEEWIETFEFYSDLHENAVFLSQMKDAISGYYFDMDEDKRAYFQSIFAALDEQTVSDLSWDMLIKRKIADCFQTDAFADFVDKEIGRMEKRYVALYFTQFLKKCREVLEEDCRKTLQETADRFMTAYSDCMDETDKKEYEALAEQWEADFWHVYMAKATLEQISDMKMDESASIKKSLKKDWCQEVIRRLEEETMLDTVMKNLVGQIAFLQDMDGETCREYMDAIWKACGTEIAKKIYCSVRFESDQHTVWSCFNIGDVERYKIVCESIKNADCQIVKERQILDPSLQKAELNRRCYLLWEQIHEEKVCDAEILDFCDLAAFRREIMEFIETLQQLLMKKEGENTAINYLKLEIKKEESWSGNPETTPSARYDGYVQFLKENPIFYEKLIEISQEGLSQPISERIRELYLIYQVSKREKVQKKNLEEMEALLDEARNYFGSDLESVRSLETEYKEIAAYELPNMRKENRQLEKKVKECEENLQKAREETEFWKRKCREIETALQNAQEEVQHRKKDKLYDKKTAKYENKRNPYKQEKLLPAVEAKLELSDSDENDTVDKMKTAGRKTRNESVLTSKKNVTVEKQSNAAPWGEWAKDYDDS